MPSSREKSQPASRRATLFVIVMAVLFVLVPVLFWHDTWFGRDLTDEQISEYLHSEDKPRKAQHALAQISGRISRGDPSAKQWYPEILALGDHPLTQLRLTAAWVMGQDVESDRFHQKLLAMLDDPEPLVRRNVALALVGFGDASGRPVLLSMLKPHTVKSPHAGILTNRLEVGDIVEPGTLLARVSVQGEVDPREIRARLPGAVKERLFDDGARVAPGDSVMIIRAGEEHVFEALRALYLVGQPEDIEEIRLFFRPPEHMSARIGQQARLTAEEIRQRDGT